MKNIVIALSIVLSISSCKKEESIEPITSRSNPYEDCNCGYVTDDEIQFDSQSNPIYTLTIRNNCTNNYGTFAFSYTTWLNTQTGTFFCLSNVNSW